MTTVENARADDDTPRRLGQTTRAEKTKADFDGRGGYGERQRRDYNILRASTISKACQTELCNKAVE
nr:hypothetical protein Itr_chr15CG07830 [Ipomoea trifida]